jgi:ribosomal protein L37AE/L43A
MTGLCSHCGRRAKLRRASWDSSWYCRKCWDRFGGSARRVNREAARRRALGQ